MKLFEIIGAIAAFCMIGIVMSCNDDLVDSFNADEQLEIDIEIIEDYLAENGYTDYDTLDSEIRVVILEEGTGEIIEYNDNIQYDYIGVYTDELLFDTSIGELAYNQDLEYTIDSTYQTDDNGDYELDDDGEKILESINYKDDYTGIFSPSRSYEPFITTHSIEGWFIQQSGYSTGFSYGVHHVLKNTNIGGRGLVLIPSFLMYGTTGVGSIDPNTVLLFEIRPLRKH